MLLSRMLTNSSRYCENGSLSNMCKKFGKFPEHLASVYITQVLEGLAFLHEQGTIHRDIKGANILTTKDGFAKLADFGVATKITKLEENPSVVGTPNWMAPEVIELNGATTASDIWSVGCTVIELLTGNPPYHRLDPMQALFAIVNNDHPPIPEGISPVVKDFLIQCFQKDQNLRVTAKKLLKHPWLSMNKKSQQEKSSAPTQYDEAVKTVRKWNEAITNQDTFHAQKVKKSAPKKQKKAAVKLKTSDDKEKVNMTKLDINPFASVRNFSESRQIEFRGMMQRNNLNGRASKKAAECWDDDFCQDDLPEKLTELAVGQKKAKPTSSSCTSSEIDEIDTKSVIKHSEASIAARNLSKWQEDAASNNSHPFKEETYEDFSDLIGELDITKFPDSAKSQFKSPSKYHPSELTGIFRHLAGPDSSPSPMPTDTTSKKVQKINLSETSLSHPAPQKISPLGSFQESEADYDYSSMFSDHPNLELGIHQRNSLETKDIHFDEDENDSDDPFENFKEDYSESNIVEDVARERLAYAQSHVESLLDSLNKNINKGSSLIHCIEELHDILYEFPETSKTIMKCHGLLLLLEVLETHVNDKILVLGLLQILLLLLEESYQSLENFCLVGGIPLVAQFNSKKYGIDIQLQAAKFISLLCDSEKFGRPMLLACGGLYILADFVEEDCSSQPEFVSIGINGIWSVFQLQGSTSRNDICRKLSKHKVLNSLSTVLKYLLLDKSEQNLLLIDRIVLIFVYFSQTESYVKSVIADRTLFCTLFKSFQQLNTQQQLSILKFIKNMSSLPEVIHVLQNANAIEFLTDTLATTTKESLFKEYANQILQTIYNLCRLSKVRQEEAAQAGIIPILQNVVGGDLPLKEFALPILCDMAHAGRLCRKVLWHNNGLDTYLKLTSDPYWQVKAYEAIATWLQEEFAKVEDYLLNEKCATQLLDGLEGARGTFFDAVLDPFQRIMRSSAALCGMLATTRLFQLIKKQLDVPRPMMRLNLLRLLRTILDCFPSKAILVRQMGLYETIRTLSESDDTVLVKELTKDLLNFSMPTEQDNQAPYMSARSRTSSSATSINGSLISLNSHPATHHAHSSAGITWKSHRHGSSQPTLPTSSQLMMPPKSPSRRTKHSAHSSLSNPSFNQQTPMSSGKASLMENSSILTPSSSNLEKHDFFHMSNPPTFLQFDIRSPSPTRSPTRTGRRDTRRPVDSLKLIDRAHFSKTRASRLDSQNSEINGRLFSRVHVHDDPFQ